MTYNIIYNYEQCFDCTRFYQTFCGLRIFVWCFSILHRDINYKSQRRNVAFLPAIHVHQISRTWVPCPSRACLCPTPACVWPRGRRLATTSSCTTSTVPGPGTRITVRLNPSLGENFCLLQTTWCVVETLTLPSTLILHHLLSHYILERKGTIFDC